MKITGRIVQMDVLAKTGTINGGTGDNPSLIRFNWTAALTQSVLMHHFFENDFVTLYLGNSGKIIEVT